jgi:hypothetical protein
MKVRMMHPVCATCATYIYKGTQFNSRKEDVVGGNFVVLVDGAIANWSCVCSRWCKIQAMRLFCPTLSVRIAPI